jgi:putative nucleotidyltransferase with HDIG domain
MTTQDSMGGLARPVALSSASSPLGRLVEVSRAIAAESESQRMLRVACRELTHMLDASACAISRVDNGLLRPAAEYSSGPGFRELCERSYYLADFPATAAALEEQVLCAISADDPLADPAELFVLREAEMQAVLLVPVVVDGRAWGLIEIYDGRPRRFSALERHLAELGAAQISALLAGFEHAEAVERLYRETLASLSNALEAKDEYTRHHTEEVVRLALAVAAELDLEPQAARNVELGAILHDVGKVRVPEPILNKPGQLDDAEWAIMKTHPEVGEHILAPIQLLRPILPIVRHHHERWDGGGYPDGLAARAIPLGARIVAVCDAYRAMTEDRPYRRALSEAAARQQLEQGSGSQFDVECVAALLHVLDRRQQSAEIVVLRPPSLDDAAGSSG